VDSLVALFLPDRGRLLRQTDLAQTEDADDRCTQRIQPGSRSVHGSFPIKRSLPEWWTERGDV